MTIDAAYDFYVAHINDAERIRLLREYNLKVAGHVHSVMWELFCALLTGERAEGITGADLKGWEVKSAKIGGNFEYQYHRHAHLEKLDEDAVVNHIFCTYSQNYDGVVVRAMKGSELRADHFDIWRPLCVDAYTLASTKRFRKNINASHVNTHGVVVLKIENGLLIIRNDDFIEQLRVR
jgi:hypothetical protein